MIPLKHSNHNIKASAVNNNHTWKKTKLEEVLPPHVLAYIERNSLEVLVIRILRNSVF